MHTVHVSSFRMGKYEVTQAQWQSVMGGNPSEFKGDKRPVEKVSWDDVQGFIRKLNSQTGQRFRLPTEAEWEYAARAGSSSKWSFGNNESQLCSYANGADQSTDYDWRNKRCNDGVGEETARVGSYKPNGFGLYDMHGNVWEWVQDCWNGSYSGAPSDGSAWLSGDCAKRVLRGGSWIDEPDSMRSAYRSGNPAGGRYGGVGFRLVQD